MSVNTIKAYYTWTKARTPSFVVGGFVGFAATKWDLVSLVLSWV